MPAQPGRVPSLDGLRAVAILAVLLSHFVNAKIFPGGLGVYVFFVISGFLITRLLFSERKRTGRIALGRFYLRRALRLFPVILAYTAIVTTGMALAHIRFDPIEPVSALFYFSNYLYAERASETAPFMIFWSLSIEEHFYILLPAAMIFIRDPRHLALAMAGVCVVCLGLRLGVAAAHPSLLDTRYFYFRSEFRLDSLAFGVGMASLCEFEFGRRLLLSLATPAVAWVGLLALAGALLVRDPVFRETLRYSLMGASLTVLVAFVLFRRTRLARLLNSPPALFVGALSYSLYVWHYIADYALESVVRHWWRPAEVVCLFAFAFAAASLSYYGLEKPLLRLRARLAP